MSTMPPESLLAMLAELDRIRALTVELIERSVPELLPAPPEGTSGSERGMYELLIGLRRAVIGNPAGARTLHDLLVAEGRRFAETASGAELRDSLVASEAVDHLRRVWQTVTLNVLDGPAPPSKVPDAWAELLADALTGRALDDAVLAHLRPEGCA
jgi:hypothetical protein